MRDRKSAFTLIELLVVVGIIALLLAILLPLISAVRACARATQCGSNLRQISIACGIYLTTSSGRLPNNSYTMRDNPMTLNPPLPAGTAEAAYAETQGYLSTSNLQWFDVVAEVLDWNGRRTVAARFASGEQELFRQRTRYLWCPDIDQSAQNPGLRATNYGICRNVSTAYNLQGSHGDAQSGALDFLCSGKVSRPADVVFLAEGRFWHSHADAYDLTNDSLGNISKYFAATPPKIHHYGLNYLFFDGHVSRDRIPPHPMGGELGAFSTSDGDTFSITAAADYSFRTQN